MRIRKSELKEVVQEVLFENEMEEAAVAKQKGVAKGARVGARPNEKKITQLQGGAQGFSKRLNDLDSVIGQLKTAKAIDAGTASQISKQLTQVQKTYRAGLKRKNDEWSKKGTQ